MRSLNSFVYTSNGKLRPDIISVLSKYFNISEDLIGVIHMSGYIFEERIKN